MKQIPIKDDALPTINKKSIALILGLTLAGILTGVMLSTVFVEEANQMIQDFINEFGPGLPPGYTFQIEPLTLGQIIYPALGVIVVCICVFFLIGLIAVYLKIFVKTKSKYVLGLLLFLGPLLAQSIYSVNTVRSLFVSSAIPFGRIRESIGFGFGGLGGIIVIVSFFEIFGLSILLYLSNE
jgi:hypothetical protein